MELLGSQRGGFFKRSPLRPDARDQQRHLPRHAPDVPKLIGMRGTDHQPAVLFLVPVMNSLGHDYEKRLAFHVQQLKVLRARVGGQAQDEDTLVLVLQERPQRVIPHVGTERHPVGAESAVQRVRVVTRRIADIPPLAIHDHRNLFRYPLADELQERQPFGAHRFVEGQIRFVRAHLVRGGIDDPMREVEHPLHGVGILLRHLLRIQVEPQTDHAAVLLLYFLQVLESGHQYFLTLPTRSATDPSFFRRR